MALPSPEPAPSSLSCTDSRSPQPQLWPGLCLSAALNLFWNFSCRKPPLLPGGLHVLPLGVQKPGCWNSAPGEEEPVPLQEAATEGSHLPRGQPHLCTWRGLSADLNTSPQPFKLPKGRLKTNASLDKLRLVTLCDLRLLTPPTSGESSFHTWIVVPQRYLKNWVNGGSAGVQTSM